MSTGVRLRPLPLCPFYGVSFVHPVGGGGWLRDKGPNEKRVSDGPKADGQTPLPGALCKLTGHGAKEGRWTDCTVMAGPRESSAHHLGRKRRWILGS